jgi:hypothetical protein
MGKAQTDPGVRGEAITLLADLWRHVAMRASLGADDPKVPKLPTRLKKLDGLDALPPAAGDQLLIAAPLLAELSVAALEAAGYVVMEWG